MANTTITKYKLLGYHIICIESMDNNSEIEEPMLIIGNGSTKIIGKGIWMNPYAKEIDLKEVDIGDDIEPIHGILLRKHLVLFVTCRYTVDKGQRQILTESSIGMGSWGIWLYYNEKLEKIRNYFIMGNLLVLNEAEQYSIKPATRVIKISTGEELLYQAIDNVMASNNHSWLQKSKKYLVLVHAGEYSIWNKEGELEAHGAGRLIKSKHRRNTYKYIAMPFKKLAIRTKDGILVIKNDGWRIKKQSKLMSKLLGRGEIT